MSRILIWYMITTIILAILLYFPVKKFILSARLNREEKKMNRAPDGQTAHAIKKETAKTAAVISVLFSILFNLFIMGRLFKKYDR